MPVRMTGRMDELLVVRNLVKSFETRNGVGLPFGHRDRDAIRAVDDISFEVDRREILGLVGESGSGKTTVARCLVRLVDPDSGSAFFDGADILGASAQGLKRIRRRMQLIYQDPYSSLNPLIRVGDAIAEPARVHGLVSGRAAADALVLELLDAVGLTKGDARRYPREMSGGQRQRVAIARALALQPEMLIADEAVSALDVSVQAQIINLFADLVENRHVAMVFISHQLAVIAQLAGRVAVMYRGRIVEIGPTPTVYSSPQHPYTALLLAAHPDINQGKRSRSTAQPPELPARIAPAAGFGPAVHSLNRSAPRSIPRQLTSGTGTCPGVT